MKKLLLTLVAAIISCIAYAAEPNILYERGYDTPWSEDDLNDWVLDVSNDKAVQSINEGLVISSNGNASVTKSGWVSSKNVQFNKNSIVTLDASIYGGGAPGRNSSYDYFKIGDVEFRLFGDNSVKKAIVLIGNTETEMEGFIYKGGIYNISIIINQATKAVSVDVTGGANGKANGTLNSDLPNTIQFAHFRGGSEGAWVNSETLKSIKITEELQVVSTASYTVNYLFNNNNIFTETGNIAVGAEVTASSPLTVDGQKYYFADGATTSMKIEAGSDNVLNVNMREAYIFNYTVKNNVNDEVKTGGSCVEGESATEFFSKYIIANDGTVWSKDVANNASHKVSFTPDKDGYVYTLEYKETAMKDGIFFKEAEDEYYTNVLIPASTAGDRGSNKLGGYTEEESAKLYTLLPGTYNVEIGAIAPAGSGNELVVKAGEETIITTGVLYSTLGKYSTTTPVPVSTETDITILGTNSSNVLDYILITGYKTAPYTLNYVLEGTETVLKTVKKNGKIGSPITLTNEDKVAITLSESGVTTTYTYVSDNSAEKTISADGSSIVNITYKISSSINDPVDTEVVTITWPMATSSEEDGTVVYSQVLTPVISAEGTGKIKAGEVALGSEITIKEARGINNVPFATFHPSTKVTAVTAGHTVTFSIETEEGYLFEPTGFDYKACKVGTNGGNYNLDYTWNGKTNNLQTNYGPKRNNEENGWFSSETLDISSVASDGKLDVTFSLYNLDNKEIGLSDVVLKGKIKPAPSKSKYTLLYVSGGKTIKKAEKEGYIGYAVTVTDEDKADFTLTEDGVTTKYTFNSVEGEDQTIAEDGTTEVILNYTSVSQFKYSIIAVDSEGNTLGTIKEGTGMENDEISYHYPEYYQVGTTLYSIKNNSKPSPYFGATGKLDSNNKEFKVTYKSGTIENVVFYKEAEEMEGFESRDTNNAPIRCSNGLGGTVKGDIVGGEVLLTTLPSGKYKIYGQLWGTKGLTAGVKTKATTEDEDDTILWEFESDGNLINKLSDEFSLYEEASLYVYTTAGTDKRMLDLIYITGQKIDAANYTVKFVDENGNEIKPAVTGRGFVGDPIVVSEEDTQNFDNGEVAYFFDGVDPETSEIAADGLTVVTVKFHQAKKVEYTVKFVDQDNKEIKASVTRTGAEGSSASVSEEDKTFIVENGRIYVYESDNTEGLKYSADGKTEVIITYRLPQIGEEFTIINETFNGEKLSESSVYSWGEEIQGMIVKDFATNKGPNITGLYLTNNDDVKNNYENRDFVTLTAPLGDDNNMLDISYKVFSPMDRDQQNTYYTINYFNDNGEFVFGVQEASCLKNTYIANIITANADGTTNTIALPNGHMNKGGGSTVGVSVKFTGDKAVIGIDGGNYLAYTKSKGIKSVKVSVTGGKGFNRDMNVENYILKVINTEAVKTADFKLEYVVDGDVIKEETVSGIVDFVPSLTSSQISDFYNEAKTEKYIYLEDDSDDLTVAADGNTVVTLTYKIANKYDYTVKNNVNSKVEDGICFEKESVTVPYNKYILASDGTVWTKGATNQQYNFTFTPDSYEYVAELVYQEYAKDGVYFIEAEDIEGVSIEKNGQIAARGSNTAGAYASDAVEVCTLKPGTYKVEIAVAGNGGATLSVFAGGEKPVVSAETNGNWTPATSEEFALEKETTITFQGGVSQKVLDYILITGSQWGDTDRDGKTTITDAIDIANFVLDDKKVPAVWEGKEDEWKAFYAKAADVNKDGKISISDASATVTLALEQKNEVANPSQARVAANYEYADNLVIGGMTTANGKTSVAVTLDNSTDFVAVQADIFMPEGVNFDVKPGSRIANSHSFQTKRFDDNHVRVVIYTFSGNAFADNNEALFEIVADSYISDPTDIALAYMLASDAAANAYTLGARYDSTTGVAALGFDSNAPVKVYDLNGRYISDKVEGLEQGFYIIRQGDNAKKVRIR